MKSNYKIKVAFKSGDKIEISTALPFESSADVIDKMLSGGEMVRIDTTDGSSVAIDTRQINLIECRKVS